MIASGLIFFNGIAQLSPGFFVIWTSFLRWVVSLGTFGFILGVILGLVLLGALVLIFLGFRVQAAFLIFPSALALVFPHSGLTEFLRFPVASRCRVHRFTNREMVAYASESSDTENRCRIFRMEPREKLFSNPPHTNLQATVALVNYRINSCLLSPGILGDSGVLGHFDFGEWPFTLSHRQALRDGFNLVFLGRFRFWRVRECGDRSESGPRSLAFSNVLCLCANCHRKSTTELSRPYQPISKR